MNRIDVINPVQPVPPPHAEPTEPPLARVTRESQPAPPPALSTQPPVTPPRYDYNAVESGRANASYSPDSWIFEPDGNVGASFLKPPKLELMRFDGNPLNWPLFIQTFQVQVHDAVRSDAERIAHLGNCLPEHVRAQLGQLIIQPGLYRCARRVTTTLR